MAEGKGGYQWKQQEGRVISKAEVQEKELSRLVADIEFSLHKYPLLQKKHTRLSFSNNYYLFWSGNKDSTNEYKGKHSPSAAWAAPKLMFAAPRPAQSHT